MTLNVTVDMVQTFNINGKCLQSRFYGNGHCDRHSCQVILKDSRMREFSLPSQTIQNMLDVVPHESIKWPSHFYDVRANWVADQELSVGDGRAITILRADHNSIVSEINKLLTQKFNALPDAEDLADIEEVKRKERANFLE